MKYWMNIWFVILAAVSSLYLQSSSFLHLSQLIPCFPETIEFIWWEHSLNSFYCHPLVQLLSCLSFPACPPHPHNRRGNPWVGFPGGSVVKNPPANARHAGSVPGLRRSPGKGNDNPLQYFCLGNPLDRGACQATVHGLQKELDTTQQLSNNTNSWVFWIPSACKFLEDLSLQVFFLFLLSPSSRPCVFHYFLCIDFCCLRIFILQYNN